MFSILTGRDVIADSMTTTRRIWPLFSSSGLPMTTRASSEHREPMTVQALAREATERPDVVIERRVWSA